MSPLHTLFLALLQILQQQHHYGCELLYLFDYETPNKDSPSHIFDSFDIKNLNKLSSGARTLSLFSTKLNLTLVRHGDVHRFALNHCALGVFFFEKFQINNGQLEPWLFDNITPRYAPIIRKDQDRFIFLTRESLTAKDALLSPKFGEKIKYKIALYLERSRQRSIPFVECVTADFYANNGKPVIKSLKRFSGENNKANALESGSLFPDMTHRFNGKTFRITVPNVKYRFEMEWRDNAFHPKRGFYKWWLDEAIKKFNFTYNMFWSSYEKATGKPLANGTWVGAAGDLLYDRADIAVIVGETYSRHPFFGFSAVLSYEWFLFVTHKPWGTYSPNAIFWPFTPLMWGLFFASLMAMTLSLKLITEAASDPALKNSNTWTYSRMFDYVFTTFMEQDRDGPVSTHSIRMLCAFWLLFALITSTAYRGKLVTLIAFPVDSWIPTTFQELAYSHFGVILNNVGKVGAAYDMLSSSTNPIFQTIFRKMEMIGEPELCLMKALKEDFGCIMWEGITVYANARNISDKFGYSPMAQSREIALFIKDGFTYERRAIFNHHMDRTIDAALQMGLTMKWLQLDKDFIRRERLAWEMSVNKTEIVFNRDEGPAKLVLSQFTGLFILCAVGLVIATCRLIMELMLFYRYRKSTRFKLNLIQIRNEHNS